MSCAQLCFSESQCLGFIGCVGFIGFIGFIGLIGFIGFIGFGVQGCHLQSTSKGETCREGKGLRSFHGFA